MTPTEIKAKAYDELMARIAEAVQDCETQFKTARTHQLVDYENALAVLVKHANSIDYVVTETIDGQYGPNGHFDEDEV